jgi:hypothetical protein
MAEQLRDVNLTVDGDLEARAGGAAPEVPSDDD